MFRAMIVSVLFFSCFLQSFAAEYEGYKSLKGIDSVGIEVNGLKVSDAQYGMFEREFADYVAVFLHRYEITPVSAEKIDKVPGRPIFRLYFNTQIDPKMNVAAVLCEICLVQDVSVVRDEKIEVIQATTWDNSSIALMQPQYIKELSQFKLDEFLQQFVEDLYKANSKPSPFKNNSKEKII